MTFKNRNLSVIAYANGWTFWLYKDMEESVSSMMKKGFFDDVKTLMDINDVMYLIGCDGVKHVHVYAIDTVAVKEIC